MADSWVTANQFACLVGIKKTGKLYDVRAFSSLLTPEFVASEETPPYLVFLNLGELLLPNSGEISDEVRIRG